MNQQEIFNSLYAITQKKHDACKAQAAAVAEDCPTERDALQLTAGIYSLALRAGLLSGSEQAVGQMHARFRNLAEHFPELFARYQSLTEEEQSLMEIALYPELFLRLHFLEAYQTELANAEKDGDPQSIFKAKIKNDVLLDILHTWRDFRAQHGLFVFAFGA